MDRRRFLASSALAGLAAAAPLTVAVPAKAAQAESPTWPSPRGDEEPALEPNLPIVDPHHHLWDLRPGVPSFMFPEVLADLGGSGHNVTQTVFIECGSMYRAEGPREMRFVGEVEFVNGVAAQSASGNYGPMRVASGIVGRVDFTTGDAVKPVLEALMRAGDGRLKGTRYNAFYTEIPVWGMERAPVIQPKGLLADTKFRQGAASLAEHGLSMDTGCFHPQLMDMVAFVSAVPNVTMVLNHVGGPLIIGPYATDAAGTFADWKKGMTELAKRPNVVVKLGGLGQDWNYPSVMSVQRRRRSLWRQSGNRGWRRRSSCSVCSGACSRATSRSTRPHAATAPSGTRSSASRRALRRMRRPSSMPASRGECIGSRKRTPT